MTRKAEIALFCWLPAILWMAVIFSVSSISGDEIPKIGLPNIDKVMHFLEYLILGLLLIRAFFRSYPNIALAKMAILAIIIAALYGASDEWHQRFVPNRRCDIADLSLDFLGINIGVLLYHLNKREQNCHR